MKVGLSREVVQGWGRILKMFMIIGIVGMGKINRHCDVSLAMTSLFYLWESVVLQCVLLPLKLFCLEEWNDHQAHE